MLAILGLLLGATIVVASASGRARTPATARVVAGDLRLRRQQAVSGRVTLGLHFQRQGPHWSVRLLQDDDGDGIQVSGRAADPVLEGPHPFASVYGPAEPGFLPGLTGLTTPPPSPRPLTNLDDPVKFGSGDLVTFNSRGECSSGTLYLTDGRFRQWAVVLYGATGRVRTWEWDRGGRHWVPR